MFWRLTRDAVHKPPRGRTMKSVCEWLRVLLLLLGVLPPLHLAAAGSKRWRWSDKCNTSCSLGLAESIPEDLPYPDGSPSHISTYEAWTILLSSATSRIDISAYYWSLIGRGNTSDPTDVEGKIIFEGLVSAAKRGVKIRVVQNTPTSEMPDTDSQLLASMGAAEVRNLSITALTGHGILHTKMWVVDQKHFFVGSANLDWRSFTQVKELGVLGMECPCLAEDAEKLFEIYWYLATPTSHIPHPWPPQYDAMFNLSHPALLSLNDTPATVFWSSSPPSFCAQYRTPDLEALLHIIDSAQTNISIAVMDYAPAFVYHNPRSYWPVVDDALRRAAYDRGVHVRFLGSVWEHTAPDQIKFLASLAADSPIGSMNGTIQARLFRVPPVPGKNIPYTRVNHNKYMVTDNAAYITTSNWSADYWNDTGGLSLTFNQTDISPSNVTLQYQLSQVFLRDWNSKYAQDIHDYLY